MGEVLPLRFGGGGVRALVAPMVACVSCLRTATAQLPHSYRVEGPADSRCPKHSLAWGPRGTQEAMAQLHTPTVAKITERRRGRRSREARARGRCLGIRRGVPRGAVCPSMSHQSIESPPPPTPLRACCATYTSSRVQ